MDYRIAALVVLAGALAIAVTALLIMLGQSADENARLRAETESLEANLSSAKSIIGLTKAELDRKNGDIQRQQEEIANLTLALGNSTAEAQKLKYELNTSREELEQAKSTLSEARDEIDEIKSEALEIEGRINDSIQWFQDNSGLPGTLKSDRFERRAEKGCRDGGKLNLACVSYLMEDELGFTYKDDPTGDRLYSIEDIISRKGGDCEDFSLFFKAYLNEVGEEGLEIEAWTEGFGKYVVYEDADSGKYWYYDSAAGRTIGRTGTSRPYVACYFYDTQGDVRIGHCVIMLANTTIENPEDITESGLAGSPLFEPQDGRFMGVVGDEFSVCEEGETDCDLKDYSVAFIISDNDLFQFSEGGWNYYHGQRREIESLISSLSQIELS